MMGQGDRQEPFAGRLRRGHLVVRLIAVTHLAQCRSEQLVSMSSPSRNTLNDSQEDNDVSIWRGCYRLCVLNDCAVLDWLCFSSACIAQAQECVKLRCTHDGHM